MEFKVIAIDGPTGSGKSTLARLLATEKSFLYVDTGAMFRCLGYAWDQAGQKEDEVTLDQLGKNTRIVFNPDGSVYCNDDLVTEKIRTEHISKLASQISKFPVIRQNMKTQQRQLVKQAETSGNYRGAVLEGRDIGTVIFPDAYRKFFLDANNKIRAQRRYEQLLSKGETTTYETVLSALENRDEQDRNREVAPLKPADDAIHIDSTSLSISEILHKMCSYLD